MLHIAVAFVEIFLAPVFGALAALALAINRFAFFLLEFVKGWSAPVDIRGEHVVLTGAAGGFGAAVTRRLLALGATVHAIDVLDADAEPVRALCALGGDVKYTKLDITDFAALAAFAGNLRAQRVQVFALVNNAGIALPSAAVETKPETVAKVLGVNFAAAAELQRLLFASPSTSLLRLSERRCTAGAKPTRSRIVNITSVAGVVTGSGMGTYTASKFALEAWSDCTRIECASRFLDVAIIEPYFAVSGIYRNLLDPAKASAFQGSILQEQFEKSRDKFKEALGSGVLMTADFVAATIVQAVVAAQPRDRYMVTPNVGTHLAMRFVMHAPNYFGLVDKIKEALGKREKL